MNYRDLYNKVAIYMLEKYGVFTTQATLPHDYLHMSLGLDTSIEDEMVLSAIEKLIFDKEPFSWFTEKVLERATTTFSSMVDCSEFRDYKELIDCPFSDWI